MVRYSWHSRNTFSIYLEVIKKCYWSVSHESNTPPSTLSEEFALSLLGLYLIFHGLSRLITGSVGAYYSITDKSDINYNIMQTIIYLVVYLIVAIVATSLVIKSNGVGKITKQIKSCRHTIASLLTNRLYERK